MIHLVRNAIIRIPKRDLATGIPKPTTILRAWSYAAAAGAGMISYVGYKVNEFTDRHTPEWLKSSIEKFKQINWDGIELGFSLPDIVSGVPTLEYFKPDEDNENDQSGLNPAATATMAAVAVQTGGADDPSDDESALLELSKDLIEIKNLLKGARPLPAFDPNSPDSVSSTATELASDWQLPSIVVIGSQSSGKSSVLEAIVGQEFLPKGDNMVTRRPIELTLVHVDAGNPTIAQLPSLNFETTDFKALQRTLTDLNLAVPAAECVSDDPIELVITSPHVPDLILTDLPGYIAVSSKDQPPELKEKIAAVCNKYIQEPNLILAVCSADVDLANAEALRAAKTADPKGLRTIGVLTKIDLVEPSRVVQLLQNQQYPLKLGYIGVIVGQKGIKSAANLIDSLRSSTSLSSPHQTRLIEREKSYFGSHPEFEPLMVPTDFSNTALGIPALRKTLSLTLARSLLSQLDSLSHKLHQDMLETSYYLKVHYNDMQVTPEVYVAELVDYIKQRCRAMSLSWGQRRIREEVQCALDAKVLHALQNYYWKNGKFADASFSSECLADADTWNAVLNVASSSLTKSGVGRLSTVLVKQLVNGELDQMVQVEPLSFHTDAQASLVTNAQGLFDSRETSTADQVENSIKPLKYQVELSDSEWSLGRARAITLLQNELDKCKAELQSFKKQYGKRQLRNILLEFSSNASRAAMDPSFEPVNNESILVVKQLAPILEQMNLLRARLSVLQRNECTSCSDESSFLQRFFSFRSLNNAINASEEPSGSDSARWKGLWNSSGTDTSKPSSDSFSPIPASYRCCPEVFLCALSTKLSNQAVLLIYHELLAEFFSQLPRKMEQQLSRNVSNNELQQFARQNPYIRTHIDVIERRRILESVSLKLDSLESKFSKLK